MPLTKKRKALKILFGISNAGLFLFIIVVIACCVAYLLYFFKKDKGEFTTTQHTILGGVRTLYSIIICFILLSPMIEIIRTRAEKPILIVGIDNSQSIRSNKNDSTEVLALKNELYTALNSQFDLQLLTFGEEIKVNNEPDFSERTSDYSGFINEINKRYFNLNVGAVVLVGDGVYNKGENPVQLTSKIQVPFYTMGVGDTLTSSDQAIINVSHNQNVFLNNTFQVEVEASFAEYNSPSALMQVYMGNKLIQSEEIEIPQSDYYISKTFTIKAEKSGLQNISVQLTPFEGEANKGNNYYRFTIEVHENKYNVLFLTQGPHPDIGALTITLEKQANFNVTVATPDKAPDDLSKFNLIVLNQLPSLSFQLSDYFRKIISANTSLLTFVGPNSSLSSFNNLGLGMNIEQSTTNQESYPFFNESYSVFAMPSGLQNVVSVYPPLMGHLTKYTLSGEYAVIAYQKINGIEMNYPMMATAVIENRKIGVIFGEGIWRWRLAEYQNFDNQATFDQLFVNLFNYLCLKETRDQFSISYNRITPETTPVKIKAQVFDELFQSVQNSEVTLLLTDSSNAEMNYVFDASNNEYKLNLGYLMPGRYNFKASTKVGKKEFEKEGSFVVEEMNAELQSSKANFKMLYTLAENSGGKFFTKENKDQLIELIGQNKNIKPKFHKEKNIHDLINWKLYFIAILLLLSLEWFLRKFWGSY